MIGCFVVFFLVLKLRGGGQLKNTLYHDMAVLSGMIMMRCQVLKTQDEEKVKEQFLRMVHKLFFEVFIISPCPAPGWYQGSPGWQKLSNRATGGGRKVRISTKGRVPNIRYFIANSHFVTIYAPLRMLLQRFQ